MIDRIYLGDRSLKGIVIDTWNRVVRLEIDLISRLPENSEQWDFYDKEDLENGYLVFSNISYFRMNPEGCIPDDYIISFEINEVKPDIHNFEMKIVGSVQSEVNSECICSINIGFTDSWLENKNKIKVC